jgi:Flp pilus assembly protein TadB
MLHRLARVDTLRDRVRAAGRGWSVEDVIAAKVLTAVGAAGIAVALVPTAPLAAAVAIGAFLLPDLVLARAARARLRAADAEVPQFLDLLAAASSAGLAAPAAIARAATGLRGPLADELASASAAVGIGGRWREELAAIGERLRLPDLRMVVAAITRTESLGSSLADVMRGLAEDVREARRPAPRRSRCCSPSSAWSSPHSSSSPSCRC